MKERILQEIDRRLTHCSECLEGARTQTAASNYLESVESLNKAIHGYTQCIYDLRVLEQLKRPTEDPPP